jgi:flagellar biosynthesis chaperone FliJ
LNRVLRFRFRLQRILDWQQRVCQLEEEQLRQRLAEAAETQEKLAQLAANSVAIEEEFFAQPRLAPADLKALAEFRRKTVAERRLLGSEQGTRQAAVTVQREKLLAEKRTLQVYEKLRERAHAEYARATDRELEALGLESYLSTLTRLRSPSTPE